MSAGSPAQAPTDLAGLFVRQSQAKKKRGIAPLRIMRSTGQIDDIGFGCRRFLPKTCATKRAAFRAAQVTRRMCPCGHAATMQRDEQSFKNVTKERGRQVGRPSLGKETPKEGHTKHASFVPIPKWDGSVTPPVVWHCLVAGGLTVQL